MEAGRRREIRREGRDWVCGGSARRGSKIRRKEARGGTVPYYGEEVPGTVVSYRKREVNKREALESVVRTTRSSGGGGAVKCSLTAEGSAPPCSGRGIQEW